MPFTSQKNPVQAKRAATGMTLLRILALVAILGLLASWALSKFHGSDNAANSTETATAISDISDIMQGLKQYQKAHGQYPTAEQGLLALVIKPEKPPVPANWQTGGYVKRLPRDPWGNSYQYRILDAHKVEVFSFGSSHPEEATAETRISKISS
jgi:general secretion pathway protein G